MAPKKKTTKPRKPPVKAMVAEVVEFNPIEDAIMNPIEIKREKDEYGMRVKVESETVEGNLTRRQEKFCQLYTGEGSFFGNGVKAYLEIYDVDTTKTGWYKNACSLASRLTSNAKVIDRINSLLEGKGMNDEFMDKQLLFLATQHTDFGNKLGAVKEYNKLKGRIVDKSQNTTVDLVALFEYAMLQRSKE